MKNSKKNSKKNVVKNAAYWVARVNKLVPGRSVDVPGYAKVTCTHAATEKRSRRFKITGTQRDYFPAGGNLTLKVVRNDINVAM